MLKTQLGISGNKISNWQFKVSNWTFLLKLNNVDNFWIRSCEEGPSWLEELSKIVAEELILSLCVLKKDETKTLLFTWHKVFIPAQQSFKFINLNRVCLKFLNISDKWVLFKQLALVAAAVILSWTIFRSIKRARPSLRVTCSFHVTNVGRVDLIPQHLALGLLSVWSRGLMIMAVKWLQKRIDNP